MQIKFSVLLMVALLVFTGSASAAVIIQMNLVDSGGTGAAAGTITAEQTSYGVVFTPELQGLTPGAHGFHVHQHPSCQAKEKNGKMVPALAAGGHFDPAAAGHHGTPWGSGHLGDLPALDVDADGRASIPVLAPRLKLEDLQGRSIMIHAGGDNYSDQPKKLGGGGARMACGVVK